VLSDFWAQEIYPASPRFIRFLISRKVTPSALFELAQKACQRPDLKLIPPSPDPSDPDEDYIALFRRLVEIWKTDENDIRQLLRTSLQINRRSYTKPKIERWLNSIANFLESPDPPGAHIPDAIVHFSKSQIIKKSINKKQDHLPHPFFSACEDLALVFDKHLLVLKHKLVDHVRKQMPEKKRRRNIQSFDDLLHHLAAALTGKGGERLIQGIRHQFQAALIDEFQDTDQVQYQIFHRVFHQSQSPLFLIGDPKQSIYAFRGADIFAYLDAVETCDHRFTMATNWRSDPLLIQAINALFSNRNHPFFLPQIPYCTVNPRPHAKNAVTSGTDGPTAALQIRFLPRKEGTTQAHTKGWAKENLPLLVAQDIQSLFASTSLNKQKVQARDIAVLVRTNVQARAIQKALKQHQIPCVLTSDTSVYASPEAQDLLHVMQAVCDPNNEVFARTALATDLLGVSAEQLLVCADDESAWEKWLFYLHDWKETWNKHGFLKMFRKILAHDSPGKSHSVQTRLLSEEDGERRITNYMHLAELLQAAGFAHGLSPENLILHYERQHQTDANTSEQAQLRLEQDDQAIKIVTIHKSKGLQFNIVYCPYLWEGQAKNKRPAHKPIVFHDPEDSHAYTLDLGSTEKGKAERIAQQESMAESLRLAYVALTRAKHLCITYWGALSTFDSSPLAYLLNPSWVPALQKSNSQGQHVQDTALLNQLENLKQRGKGSIQIDLVPNKAASHPAKISVELPSLRCRKAIRSFDRQSTFFSFSSLTQDDPPRVDKKKHEDPTSPNKKNPTVLGKFVRGTKGGNCFHEIFENLDFCESDPRHLEVLVETKLFQYGLADPHQNHQLVETLSTAIRNVLDAPLDSSRPKMRLCSLAKHDRINEMEFLVAPTKSMGIHLNSLVDILNDHRTTLPSEEVKHLRSLDSKKLSTFLKGFIDLVFLYEGRYFIADYKSNFLGDNLDDYNHSSVIKAMVDHHYTLQYHLYCLALDRYLERCDPQYEYDKSFGGVYYLFIRGMTPKCPGNGIVFSRPKKELIKSLSGVFSAGTQRRS
jgi:exodeoxyribonuclease V beta subunit